MFMFKLSCQSNIITLGVTLPVLQKSQSTKDNNSKPKKYFSAGIFSGRDSEQMSPTSVLFDPINFDAFYRCMYVLVGASFEWNATIIDHPKGATGYICETEEKHGRPTRKESTARSVDGI